MAVKNAKKPRPNKNSNGQDKRPVPTMSHDIHVSPGEPPAAPAPPGAPPPGHVNPMTHPEHPAMGSSLGQPAAPAGPQIQERIQYKDLNPSEQSQAVGALGIDPYAPMKQAQQGVDAALQQGASTGPIPNMLAGPYVPPGVEAFPDDMAHLTKLMGQGFAPGSSPQEHELGLNAHAMARAKIEQAIAAGQNNAPPTATPYAPAPPPSPAAPPAGMTTLAPGVPTGLGSSLGGAQPPAGGMSPGAPPTAPGSPPGPPVAPGAPGGIPPELIAALLAKHKQNHAKR
jgi:hypothetical protein